MIALYNTILNSKNKNKILVKTTKKNFLIIVNGTNYTFYDKLESMVISIKLILFLLLQTKIKEISTFGNCKKEIIFPIIKLFSWKNLTCKPNRLYRCQMYFVQQSHIGNIYHNCRNPKKECYFFFF